MSGKDKEITLESNIMEVVQTNPKTAEVFMKHGLPCVGCAASRFEKISDVVAEFGVDEEELVKELNEAVDPTSSRQGGTTKDNAKKA